MSIITFKTTDNFKKNLILISQIKGINMSAYIKLVLTNAIKKELNRLAENGLTVSEELKIINSSLFDEKYGPFDNPDELISSLKGKKAKKSK